MFLRGVVSSWGRGEGFFWVMGEGGVLGRHSWVGSGGPGDVAGGVVGQTPNVTGRAGRS